MDGQIPRVSERQRLGSCSSGVPGEDAPVFHFFPWRFPMGFHMGFPLVVEWGFQWVWPMGFRKWFFHACPTAFPIIFFEGFSNGFSYQGFLQLVLDPVGLEACGGRIVQMALQFVVHRCRTAGSIFSTVPWWFQVSSPKSWWNTATSLGPMCFIPSTMVSGEYKRGKGLVFHS